VALERGSFPTGRRENHQKEFSQTETKSRKTLPIIQRRQYLEKTRADPYPPKTPIEKVLLPSIDKIQEFLPPSLDPRKM